MLVSRDAPFSIFLGVLFSFSGDPFVIVVTVALGVALCVNGAQKHRDVLPTPSGAGRYRAYCIRAIWDGMREHMLRFQCAPPKGPQSRLVGLECKSCAADTINYWSLFDYFQ